jgi:hypothetical protein
LTELLFSAGTVCKSRPSAWLSCGAVSDRPHSTADDIDKVVRAEIGAISHQAVYDALGTLADKGLLLRIQPSGSPRRFENRVGDNHHHLICQPAAGWSTSIVRSATPPA